MIPNKVVPFCCNRLIPAQNYAKHEYYFSPSELFDIPIIFVKNQDSKYSFDLLKSLVHSFAIIYRRHNFKPLSIAWNQANLTLSS